MCVVAIFPLSVPKNDHDLGRANPGFLMDHDLIGAKAPKVQAALQDDEPNDVVAVVVLQLQ